MGESVTHPDGSGESWDEPPDSGYRRWGSDGATVEERTLTSEELDRIDTFEKAPARDATVGTLHDQARAAYIDNQAFIDAATTVAFPLTVGSQQALVRQTADLSRQVNALIRLVVAHDMLD